MDDFNTILGPKIRNSIATLTKQKKNSLDNVCQICNLKKGELDAAHKQGRSRKDVIRLVLENYRSDDGKYVIQNLHEVIEIILEQHKPIEDHFLFLCKECHRKYDHADNTTKLSPVNYKHSQKPKILVERENLSSNSLSENKSWLGSYNPVSGEEFTESELYDKFQVRNSGGIRPSNKNRVILLINSFFSEQQGGYENRSDSEFVYYVGEGEKDQKMIRNNKSVLESKRKNYRLLYFDKLSQNRLIFRFPAEYTSWSYGNQRNAEGKNRQVIIFKLKILNLI